MLTDRRRTAIAHMTLRVSEHTKNIIFKLRIKY